MKQFIADTIKNKSHAQGYFYLQEKPLEPKELEELAALSRLELEQLLEICQIVSYNDCPVTALTDNEIRMAYCAWRGHEIETRRAPAKLASKRLLKIIRLIKQYTERGYFG